MNDRPELRSSCCNAPVKCLGWGIYKGLDGIEHRYMDYTCEDCTNTCSIRDPDQEEFER